MGKRSVGCVLAVALALSVRWTGCAAAPRHEAVEVVRPEPVRPPLVRRARRAHVTVPELLDLPAELPASPLPPPEAVPMSDERRAEYEASGTRSVVDIQPWRVSRDLSDDLRIVDLHPRFHRSLLLTVGDRTFALENRRPSTILVDLGRSDAEGLAIVHLADDVVIRCAPWAGAPSELDRAVASGLPYVPICGDHLLVRNTTVGRRSTLEWATAFVRANVAGGDHITSLVKSTTQDRHRKVASIAHDEQVEASASGPAPIPLAPESAGATIDRGDLGLPVDAPRQVHAGAWLEVTGHPGVFASAVAPRLVALPEDEPNRSRVMSKDAAEGGALALLMAFDLRSFDLEYEVGTEHPAVGWSARAGADQLDPRLPGPDGFATLEPLARTGQVPPAEAVRLEAALIGGFKREHGAFKDGTLGKQNRGSHYGVVQDGVVQSKLQPGLATLVVYAGQDVQILTWTEAHDVELERVLHARQNGIPLLQSVDGRAEVSPLISNWREGNWSGSATGDSRTIRAGACIQRRDDRRYLIYGYFTAATPKAMARVFLAAGCTDAIHLDMNALEHTYAAVYETDATGRWRVHHLDKGMAVLDKERKGVPLPRFVAMADNRDFFTLLRKEVP